uniref:Uncharacterized protein n=1 Tax=Anguilla anguilla TaxID=7936 RepID=A0A0E9VCL7_ANGAN
MVSLTPDLSSCSQPVSKTRRVMKQVFIIFIPGRK